MSRKKMCIIWKWLDLIDSPLQTKAIPINDDAENTLIQISENAFFELDESWLNEVVHKNIQEGDQVFFFIHKDKLKLESPVIRNLASLCQAITSCHFFEFGGGEDYLYYLPATQKGLLNQVGSIQGELKEDEGSVLCFDPTKGIQTLDSNLFLDTWEHYESLILKKKIYEMRHDVLTDMFTGAFNEPNIYSWALNQTQYLNAVFMDKKTSEAVLPLRKTQDPVFMETYATFQKFLHQNNPDAQSFRAITANLLQQIAGII